MDGLFFFDRFSELWMCEIVVCCFWIYWWTSVSNCRWCRLEWCFPRADAVLAIKLRALGKFRCKFPSSGTWSLRLASCLKSWISLVLTFFFSCVYVPVGTYRHSSFPLRVRKVSQCLSLCRSTRNAWHGTYSWYAIALVGGWFLRKDINTMVSIYFLGYLIWTSAVTWHKVTWPKTSECKYTNTLLSRV